MTARVRAHISSARRPRPAGPELCVRRWPDGPQVGELLPAQRCIVGGVGRKP